MHVLSKQTKTLLRIAALILGMQFRANAQTVENTLATYATNFAKERAYLHYDKAAYAPGETVWFKAYLMEGISPAVGSKTLYIDWVDEKGTVLMHQVSPVVDGMSNGQFEIPAAYAATFLHVRAYTRWMLNFDTAFLYNHDIRIASKQQGAAKPVVATPQLQFFPEGGDAIAGLKNKVAFLAADQWGRPVTASGTVQNSAGATVASFAAQHDGMGAFYWEPQTGVTYTAKWKDSKGAAHSTPLPTAKVSGVSLQLTLQDAKRRFVLTRSATASETMQQLHLVGTMDETMVFKTEADLRTNAAFSGVIPTENLPTGILTITVFDAAWNAIAERITFVKNNDYAFEPQFEVAHWGLNKRARNEIQITLPDSLDASLSVAVTDNALATDSSNNIISHLLLSSEIKGYVAHPEYYFSANTDVVNQHLDLVMLTHGWRRFKWEAVVKGKLPTITYPKDTTYLALSGKLYGAQTGGAGGNIMMFVKERDSSSKMVMQVVNPDGTFNNPEAIFFDTLQVYYQLQPSKIFKDADVKFMPDRMPPLNYIQAAPQFLGQVLYRDTIGNYRLQWLAREQARVSDLMKEKMLENVTVQAKTKAPVQVLDEKYASGLFSGADSYQFDLVHDPLSANYPNIFTYLQGKVAGLQIVGGSAGGQTSLQWRGGTPAVYLDQMSTDVSMLSSVPVSDIAYVKVFRPPFMGGANGGSGAIAIYTRKGNDAPVTPGKGLNRNTIMGYSPVKQFYAPNYDRFDARNEQRDLRTTLYWNPSVVVTPGKRTVTLVFYNNDITKAFRVIIEGMSRGGQLAHLEQVME